MAQVIQLKFDKQETKYLSENILEIGAERELSLVDAIYQTLELFYMETKKMPEAPVFYNSTFDLAKFAKKIILDTGFVKWLYVFLRKNPEIIICNDVFSKVLMDQIDKEYKASDVLKEIENFDTEESVIGNALEYFPPQKQQLFIHAIINADLKSYKNSGIDWFI